MTGNVMKMKLVLATLNGVLLVTPAFAEVSVNVPSDTGASYFVMDLKKVNDGSLEITTRREGASGTSYATRKVTCSPLRFGYIADSDDLAGLSNRDENPSMSELVPGSISDVISEFACNH